MIEDTVKDFLTERNAYMLLFRALVHSATRAYQKRDWQLLNSEIDRALETETILRHGGTDDAQSKIQG